MNVNERAARIPLCIALRVRQSDCGQIGSIGPALADALRTAVDLRNTLATNSLGEITLLGDPTQALAQLADWLRVHKHAGAWRNEQLAVRDAQGRQVATVERGATRPLGIKTQSVHLVGVTPTGNIWVQQRSLSKADDPGLWDTLVGGMIGAGETWQSTLQREAWEEAGLDWMQFTSQGNAVQDCGIVTVCCDVSTGTEGLMVEEIRAVRCLIQDEVVPQNQDGEVVAFACLTPAQLASQIDVGKFTLVASLVIARCMEQRTTK